MGTFMKILFTRIFPIITFYCDVISIVGCFVINIVVVYMFIYDISQPTYVHTYENPKD